MAEEFDKMAALANELIGAVEQLEAENAELRKQTKTAAAAPVVSDDCALGSCTALVKAGLIRLDQVPQVKRAFLQDPEAIHRTMAGVLEESQRKMAAAEEAGLRGGTLIGGTAQQKNVFEDSMEKMESILSIGY